MGEVGGKAAGTKSEVAEEEGCCRGQGVESEEVATLAVEAVSLSAETVVAASRPVEMRRAEERVWRWSSVPAVCLKVEAATYSPSRTVCDYVLVLASAESN